MDTLYGIADKLIPFFSALGYICALYVLPPHFAEKLNLMSKLLRKVCDALDKISAYSSKKSAS